VCTTNVNLIDVAPTVLDAAGLHAPDEWLGRSLLRLANEADDPLRVGFSEYHAVGSPSAAYLVRRERWAYHHYVGYPPELFDEEVDPGQTVDLAADPAHAGTVERMQALLYERLDPVAVDRRAKDAQNALVARFGGREAALQLGPKGATPVPSS
jgi:choline-sulfatase